MPRMTKAEKKELASQVKEQFDRIINTIEERYGKDASTNAILSQLIMEIAVLKLEIKILDEVKAEVA